MSIVIALVLFWLLSSRQNAQWREQKLAMLQRVEILATKLARWHRLQERLVTGQKPMAYELSEAQTDIASALKGLELVLR